MKEKNKFQNFIVSLLLIFLFPMTSAFSQIYKWVDESGNVHFGDKPKDSKTSQGSEKVELEQGYSPGEGLPPEQIEAQQEFLRRKDHDREEQKKEDEKTALKNKELRAKCELMQTRLKDFTDVRLENGRRKMTDYFVEDGKPVSSKRQQEIVTDLQRKVADKCN